MDAQHLLPLGRQDSLARLARAAALAALASLIFVSLGLLIRRMTGGFARPLPASLLLGLGLLSSATVLGIRFAWRLETKVLPGFRWLWLLVPGMALCSLAIAVSLPQSSGFALATVWLMLLAEEGFCWWWELRGASTELLKPLPPQPRGESSISPTTTPPLPLADLEEVEELDEESLEHSLAAGVTQQIERVRHENETESIHALLRGRFAAGQRTLSLHLAFCPPLTGALSMQAHQLDGSSVTIREGELETYGTRIDLKLELLSGEPQEVIIAVDVTAQHEEQKDFE